MIIDELRIYAGCLEQGLDFREYFLSIDKNLHIKNIYPTKSKGAILQTDSILQRITKLKDFDIAITIVSQSKEIPILMVEYSTAVPTDDHKMQRSDVYFWTSIFQVVVLKISPLAKDSFANHGGGDKITLPREISLTLKQKAVVYFVDWQSDKNSQLITNDKRLSCVAHSFEIHNILANILDKVKKYADFAQVYENLLCEQIKHFSDKELQNLQNIFVDSTRFQRIDKKVIVKINRFGHAMDPDRGILFFVSQLFGVENIITKFIIQRERAEGKESYKTLFCGLSQSIKAKISPLLTKPFSEKTALDIFKIAIGITLDFTKITSKRYKILDNDLKDFLQTYKSTVYKSIFLNSCRLQLCNYNHSVICEIEWSDKIIKDYLSSLKTDIKTPLKLYPLSSSEAKEDIITYASIKLLEKIECKILAVSYPDAQGDKAILIGQGRATKRIYLDIIATISNSKQIKPLKIFVLLQENKAKYADLKDDENKLLDLKNNHFDSLEVLLEKLDFTHTLSKNDIYLGLGSKCSKKSTLLNVDYIFAFDIQSTDTQTIVSWNIAIINFDLCDIFRPLLDAQNKLQGKIMLDLVYKS